MYFLHWIRAVVCSNIPPWIAPNHLTCLRIALAPAVVVALLYEWRWCALSFFCIGAFLDTFDGALARYRGATSSLGAFLDPVADKLFFLPPLVWLLPRVAHGAAVLIVALLFLEGVLAVLGIGEWLLARRRGRTCRGANRWGKRKTVTEAVLLALLLPPFVATDGMISMALLTFAVVSAFGSIAGRMSFFTRLVAGEEIDAVG